MESASANQSLRRLRYVLVGSRRRTVDKEGTRLRRFGLVTTNSITQPFQRKIVEAAFESGFADFIVLAIPDHPWTKASKDAAAVRIAMTVAAAGQQDGLLRRWFGRETRPRTNPQSNLLRDRVHQCRSHHWSRYHTHRRLSRKRRPVLSRCQIAWRRLHSLETGRNTSRFRKATWSRTTHPRVPQRARFDSSLSRGDGH